jgi:hypothetical protein
MSKITISVYDVHEIRWGILPLHHLIITGCQASTKHELALLQFSIRCMIIVHLNGTILVREQV